MGEGLPAYSPDDRWQEGVVNLLLQAENQKKTSLECRLLTVVEASQLVQAKLCNLPLRSLVPK